MKSLDSPPRTTSNVRAWTTSTRTSEEPKRTSWMFCATCCTTKLEAWPRDGCTNSPECPRHNIQGPTTWWPQDPDPSHDWKQIPAYCLDCLYWRIGRRGSTEWRQLSLCQIWRMVSAAQSQYQAASSVPTSVLKFWLQTQLQSSSQTVGKA